MSPTAGAESAQRQTSGGGQDTLLWYGLRRSRRQSVVEVKGLSCTEERGEWTREQTVPDPET